jgi:phosphatidylglycerophosphatase A
MKKIAIYTFASFFGTGFAPIAPATVASFAFAVIWGFAGPVPISVQTGLFILVMALGVPAATWVERRVGKDPSVVVCDEIAGMIITYFAITTGWAGWIIGFFWFRFFDIAKPWPVRKFEDLPEGWGIMVDDVAAGIYAHIALRITLAVTGW